MSFTVPLIKGDSICGRVNVEDFRGISISPVISTVLEHCIIERFSEFLNTTDNKFGFKKNLGCSHVIYSLRIVIDRFISGGFTVNVCLLDLSKAFDKVSHYASYIKLINHNIHLNLLNIIENWFTTSYTCVRWRRHSSNNFCKLTAGVRQGGVRQGGVRQGGVRQGGVRQGDVLSPRPFAIFVDDLPQKIDSCDLGCHMSLQCISIFYLPTTSYLLHRRFICVKKCSIVMKLF